MQSKISVRALVEFLLRSGDLTSGGGSPASRDAMQAGARVHRKIQKSRGASYRAEVPLKFEKEYEDVTICIEGRADGIYTSADGTIFIEEIKGVYRDVMEMEEPIPVHLAQAKCYAFIYGLEQSADVVGVRMTYVNLETDEMREFESIYEMSQLDLFFAGLLDEYHQWAAFLASWKKERDASMEDLAFPFEYRPGQREMVADIYHTITQKKQLFVQAPTGIGKTISAIFPSVRAVGQQMGEKIFYVTAKNTTRDVAESAFSLLRENGLKWKSLVLTAKEKICPMEEVNCDPTVCPYAKGHYDRVNKALFEMLTEGESYDVKAVNEQCEKHQVCPFEFQLDLATFMDAIIGDYNYVFDPSARLKRFFGEGSPKGEWLYLVDEAHNLVERGREMFSADLSRSEFSAVAKQYKGQDAQLEKALKRCMTVMLRYRKECVENTDAESEEALEEREQIGDLLMALMNASGVMEMRLAGNAATGAQMSFGKEASSEMHEELLQLYFRINSFLTVADLLDENYLIYDRALPGRDLQIRLSCVNPAVNLQKILDRGRSAVFFSATMLPMRYYKGLLSTREDDFAVAIPSPFSQKNRLLMLGTDVSTVYKRRTPDMYAKIAAYIHETVSAKKGNYMVFFPSYRVMEEALESYRAMAEITGVEILVQESGMSEADRRRFLDAFRSEERTESPLVGFCVMGGVFAEGIDLTGDRLIGSIIVGTGLPQISAERELLRRYYDRQNLDGFAYAYRYPGLNKVLQSAGRVIRTASDRGVILLLDERFRYTEYRRELPTEWNDLKTVTMHTCKESLLRFWGDQEEYP